MPLSQLAVIRYQALDKCFSDQTRYYFIEELVEAVNKALVANGQTPISKRSVQYAINQMEGNPDWNVVFVEPACINGKRYYRYADPNYSIWHRDLNEQQLTQLKSMLLMLQQFEGLPQFERVKQVVKELEEHYHFDLANTKNIISFDTNQYVEGLEFLSVLFEAIVNKQSLRITYHPFRKKPYSQVVHPFYIKQYNGRWFLFALHVKDENRTIVNMGLDRIEQIDFAHVPYVENDDFDTEEYFGDIIGVTKEKEAEVVKIVLRFSEHRFPYVQRKPMHESQTDYRKEERIIELKLSPNKEFYQKLLSYGEDVEVVEPKEVRKVMMEKVEEMYKLYQK